MENNYTHFCGHKLKLGGSDGRERQRPLKKKEKKKLNNTDAILMLL